MFFCDCCVIYVSELIPNQNRTLPCIAMTTPSCDCCCIPNTRERRHFRCSTIATNPDRRCDPMMRLWRPRPKMCPILCVLLYYGDDGCVRLLSVCGGHVARNRNRKWKYVLNRKLIHAFAISSGSHADDRYHACPCHLCGVCLLLYRYVPNVAKPDPS